MIFFLKFSRISGTIVPETDATGSKASQSEDVFRIVTDGESPGHPFKLRMNLRQGNTCTLGPFHSVESAVEAANRIWNWMLKGNIDISEIRSGGFVGVVSRVVFPNF